MRHAIDHRKLRRNPAHRKALLRNLMNALVRSERIVTTVAKAKELRRLADRLVTLGKRNDTHARRLAFSRLGDKENTEKIFTGLAARFAERAGGYTRIVRTGHRAGDGSEMAIIEYLPAEEKKAPAKGKGRRKKAAEGRPKAGAAKEAKPSRKAPAAKSDKKPGRRKAETQETEESSRESRGKAATGGRKAETRRGVRAKKEG